MNNTVNPVGKLCGSIGALPTSYLVSLSYEQQLMYLCNKMDEIIRFINGNITDEIKQYIDEEFNNIMLNATYDSGTETLVLYLDNVGD